MSGDPESDSKRGHSVPGRSLVVPIVLLSFQISMRMLPATSWGDSGNREGARLQLNPDSPFSIQRVHSGSAANPSSMRPSANPLTLNARTFRFEVIICMLSNERAGSSSGNGGSRS